MSRITGLVRSCVCIGAGVLEVPSGTLPLNRLPMTIVSCDVY
jgi:hypothetical protein